VRSWTGRSSAADGAWCWSSSSSCPGSGRCGWTGGAASARFQRGIGSGKELELAQLQGGGGRGRAVPLGDAAQRSSTELWPYAGGAGKKTGWSR